MGSILESPFGMDKHVMFGDMFPGLLSADTPGRLMHLDPPLSVLSAAGSRPLSTMSNGDSLRFDFDEVVQHFPSPRSGAQLGASPGRWCSGSTVSVGSSSIFTFPDGLYPKGVMEGGGATGAADAASGQLSVKNIYAKKMRRAHKEDSGNRDDEASSSNTSSSNGINNSSSSSGSSSSSSSSSMAHGGGRRNVTSSQASS